MRLEGREARNDGDRYCPWGHNRKGDSGDSPLSSGRRIGLKIIDLPPSQLR